MTPQKRSMWPLVAGLLGGLFVFGMWNARRHERRLATEHAPEGDFVDLADGSRLHFTRHGVPTRTPVVIIHGADGTCCSFRPLVASLSESHEVIAFDRPGHGWSTIPKRRHADVRHNAATIRRAVRKLGIERPVVLGHSYGAAVALAWARSHPREISGLVLVSPAAYPAWGRLATIGARIATAPMLGRLLTIAFMPLVGRPVLDRQLRVVAFGSESVPDDFKEIAHSFYLRPDQFAVLMHEYATIQRDLESLQGSYGRIDVPSTVVAGTGDTLTRLAEQAEPLTRALPDARLTTVPGSAHELLWHHATEVTEAIDDVCTRRRCREPGARAARRTTTMER